MKAILFLSSILLNVSAFAGVEGRTFCPQASSFHYNAQTGFVEAPGEWRIYVGAIKAKVFRFKRVEATADYEITGCFYDMQLGDVQMEFPMHSNYYYVAPFPQNANWHDGPFGMICINQNPAICTFREET